MLLSVMVCSTVTSSRNGTSGDVPVVEPGSGSALASPERTRKREQFLGAGPAGQRQLEDDVHVLLLARDVQQIHRLAADGHPQRLGNRLGADAVQRGLFLVDDEAHLRLVGFDIPVGVHHAGRVVENINDLLRQREPVLFGRPVNFGHERLQHRRAGRHFGHGHARAEFGGDGGHARTHPFGDVVALRPALALGQEVDLHVGNVRALPHEIMAHEAVEVERRSDAGINLVIGHLRFGAHGGGDFARGLRGALQRTAFRHVEDDLEFALVVERQHFHLHQADADQRHRSQQQHDETAEKNVTPTRRL